MEALRKLAKAGESDLLPEPSPVDVEKPKKVRKGKKKHKRLDEMPAAEPL